MDDSLDQLRAQAVRLGIIRPEDVPDAEADRRALARAGYRTKTPARMRSGDRHLTDRLLRQAGYPTEKE